MSRFLSVIRRLSDNEGPSNIVMLVVMALYLAGMLGFLGEASEAVRAWRLGQ